MAYLRNDLLFFEIRSFDEIVKLSLNKFIECEQSNEHVVVKELVRVYKQSRKALNRSDILFIEPEPHEKFDGKLHEVLMAKEEEGYGKGEIIKCQGIGYVKDDYVIMRANVIAAK